MLGIMQKIIRRASTIGTQHIMDKLLENTCFVLLAVLYFLCVLELKLFYQLK